MVRGFTPIVGLAVVVALALAAVFGAMSLANPAMAAPEAPADSRLTERVDAPQAAPTVSVTATASGASLSWAATAGATAHLVSVRTNTGNSSLDSYQHFAPITAPATAAPVIGGITVTLGAGAGIADVEGADVTGLSNGTEYCFLVRVRTGTGATEATSGYSVEKCATPNAAPATPTALTAMDGAGESVLIWTPGVVDSDNPAAVRWEFDRAGGTPMPVVDVKAGEATGTLTGKAVGLTPLSPPADETFRVRAISSVGVASEWSTGPTDGDATITQGPTFTPLSDKPGANTRYDIRFPANHGADAIFNTVTDDIVIELEDYSVPSSIADSAVALSIDQPGTCGDGADPSLCDFTTIADSVAVSGEKITITVGDWNKDRTGDNQGAYSRVTNLSVITVVLKQSAGIKNPTKAGMYGPTVESKSTNNPDTKLVKYDMSSQHEIDRIVKLSEEDGGLGDTVMATASGFEKNTTVRFFIDGYAGPPARETNGILEQGEDVLCAAVSSGDHVASCEFMVSTPVFKSGYNYVNAKDGDGNYGTFKMDDDQRFELKPSIRATPDGGSPGEIIQVQLASFMPGTVSRVSLGGRDVCGGPTPPGDGPCNGSVNNQGTGTTRVAIPNWAGAGIQELKVWVGDQDDNTNVTIAGPRIVSTPSTVVANQRVSLVGTGFSPNARLGAITPQAGEIMPSISIGGADIDWNDVNDGRVVNVDDSGNWSASVDLPMVEATTGEGERLIRITDSKGRTGGKTVTLAARDFDITPPSGRVGTLAVVRGVGYPGKNDEGTSFTVDVTYKVSERSETRVSVVPDASGRFEVQLRIPTTAAIPSTNQVEVSFDLERNEGSVTDVKQHMVPEGIITLSETSGGPGSTITVSGEGFKNFSPVASVKIGAINITPAPNPHTDANGMMKFDVLIPGLDVGIQTIEVQVGGTTSSTGFTVIESGIAPGDIKPVAEAMEPLGDNLVVVWHFNNDTKVWTFYDPTLTEGNTLTHTITGEPYFIRIKANQEVILNRDTRSLTCVGGNCWNPIVW